METPDFDATVFLAALAAGPIIGIVAFLGIKSHYDELRLGYTPRWVNRFLAVVLIGMWPLIFLAFNYWFFWNLAMILLGVCMTTTGTYLAGQWLYPRLLEPMLRQRPED